MSDDPQDLLIYLDPKDLVGRGARKRKGILFTREGQRAVNIWSDPTELGDLKPGKIDVTISASSGYLWYRRDAFADHLGVDLP
jgi:hypothetical protein